MVYDYKVESVAENHLPPFPLKVTIEAPMGNSEEDTEKKIAAKLSQMLKCPKDSIGRTGNAASVVHANLTELILMLAVDHAVRKSVGVDSI